VIKTDVKLFKKLSLSMFRKDFLGIIHGSISIKKSNDSFLINKRDAIFDEIKESSLVELSISQHSLWNIASIHSSVHSCIYENIKSAKFGVCIHPPHVLAYSLNNDCIIPKDFSGVMSFKKTNIYDPKDLSDWIHRAPSEILLHMKKHNLTSMVVRGVGIYAFNRNIKKLVEEVAAINRSCQVLLLADNRNEC
jgi:L-fuculose-phosphate aldolase